MQESFVALATYHLGCSDSEPGCWFSASPVANSTKAVKAFSIVDAVSLVAIDLQALISSRRPGIALAPLIRAWSGLADITVEGTVFQRLSARNVDLLLVKE